MCPAANLRAYNSLWQFRADTWSSLQDAIDQLGGQDTGERSAEPQVEAISDLLGVLEPIERYWGFPGARAFQELLRMFAAGKYDEFAAGVGRINRALVTDSFRSGRTPDRGGQDGAADPDTQARGQFGSAHPYFEVLVVEDLSEAQEKALRAELWRWRRPDDPFVYEIVVVPSFDNAVIATRLNFSLQACMVRRRFADRSAHDTSSLAQFVAGPGPDDLLERSPDERAQELARTLARIRPEMDLYLMTETSVEDLAGRLSHHFRRVFHAREGSLELHLSILEGVAARYRTPFFDALRSYSHRPTGVFHALPISRAHRSSTRTGSGTWRTSTAWTSSWPRRPRPVAGWTRWPFPAACPRAHPARSS